MAFHVSIYLEPDSLALKKNNMAVGWVTEFIRESGGIVTRNGVIREEAETTQNRLHILALAEALKCLKAGCKVQVFTRNAYLESLCMELLETLAERGWEKAAGGEAANRDALEALFAETKKHEFSFVVGKKHIYSSWLQMELRKEK